MRKMRMKTAKVMNSYFPKMNPMMGQSNCFLLMVQNKYFRCEMEPNKRVNSDVVALSVFEGLLPVTGRSVFVAEQPDS